MDGVNLYMWDDDDWADQLFGEREAAQLRTRFNTIMDEARFEPYYQIILWVPVTRLNAALDEMRAYCEEYEGELEQLLMALGRFMCLAYLLDADMEMDEDLTDHAIFFGAIETEEEEEDEEEDDGDEPV